MLRTCEALGLRLLCGIPWTQHVDFIADHEVRTDALRRVTGEARRLAAESAVLGLIVGNDVEKSLVRWMGPDKVQQFLEELIANAKEAAPEVLISYASYPSTEYLIPANADFIAFNVFLEKRESFTRYLQRLQILAAGRPLIITEFGLDARLHGESMPEGNLAFGRAKSASAPRSPGTSGSATRTSGSAVVKKYPVGNSD